MVFLRRSFALLAPTSLAALAIFACEEDSNPPPQTILIPETGVSDTNQPPITTDSSTDASLPDALPDVVADGPKPATVTMTVTSYKGPKQNVTIVFSDATGAILESKTTGADGKATSSTATAPAMVTVLGGTTDSRQLFTYTGVEGGDALSFVDQEPIVPIGTYTVTYPSPFPSSYRKILSSNGCENTTFGDVNPGTLEIDSSCVRQQMTVLVAAVGDGFSADDYAYKKANALPPSDGGSSSITTSAFATSSKTALTLLNIPNGWEDGHEFFQIADGFGYRSTNNGSFSSPQYTYAAGFADAIQAHVFREEGASFRIVGKRVAPVAAMSLDFNDLLPQLTAATLDANDARRPSVTWTSASPLATAVDGGAVQLVFTGPQDANYSWTFMVAPGATSVKAPVLPAAAEAWLPVADGGAAVYRAQPEVIFFETDLVPSYAVFRQQPGVNVDQYIRNRGGAALPQNGTIRVTRFFDGPRG